jgi:hypothetical protein
MIDSSEDIFASEQKASEFTRNENIMIKKYSSPMPFLFFCKGSIYFS